MILTSTQNLVLRHQLQNPTQVTQEVSGDIQLRMPPLIRMHPPPYSEQVGRKSANFNRGTLWKLGDFEEGGGIVNWISPDG